MFDPGGDLRPPRPVARPRKRGRPSVDHVSCLARATSKRLRRGGMGRMVKGGTGALAAIAALMACVSGAAALTSTATVSSGSLGFVAAPPSVAFTDTLN